MSVRSKFTPLNEANQGVGGACNMGILLVKHRSGVTCIEKRVPPIACSSTAETEAQVMKLCDGHPNIVAIKAYDLQWRSTGYGSLFMQHAELGSLDALITRYARRHVRLPDEGFVWKVLYDCTIGLASLQTGQDARTVRQHAALGRDVPPKRGWDPICHRDLKPSNIFMTWKNRVDTSPYPNILLGDFGCAVFGSEVRAGNAEPGQAPPVDREFMPPEAPRFSDRSDVYSLSLIILCIAGRSPQELPRWDVMRGTSPQLYKVVKQMQKHDPMDRPPPQHLPAFVWRHYQEWLRGRSDYGVALASWAYGG